MGNKNTGGQESLYIIISLNHVITGRNEVLAKVIFLHLFVILFTGGGVPDQVHRPRDQVHPPRPGTPPWTRYTPQDQVHPPGPGTPPRDQVPPLDQVPPQTRYTPPGTRYPPGPGYPPPAGTRYTPPQAANSGIRSTIGRYASYWNAFLFNIVCGRLVEIADNRVFFDFELENSSYSTN